MQQPPFQGTQAKLRLVKNATKKFHLLSIPIPGTFNKWVMVNNRVPLYYGPPTVFELSHIMVYGH